MADIMCGRCGEPCEAYYANHEAVWEHPGKGAPAAVLAEHKKLTAAADAYERKHPYPTLRPEARREWSAAQHTHLTKCGAYPAYPSAFYRAVAVERAGCPHCAWGAEAPERDDDREYAALEAAVDSANFDGDILDLFDSIL